MPRLHRLIQASLLSCLLALPALAQQASPPAGGGPIQNGRQQQPSRGETDSRLQQQIGRAHV